jgi:hypothetical protein
MVPSHFPLQVVLLSSYSPFIWAYPSCFATHISYPSVSCAFPFTHFWSQTWSLGGLHLLLCAVQITVRFLKTVAMIRKGAFDWWGLMIDFWNWR